MISLLLSYQTANVTPNMFPFKISVCLLTIIRKALNNSECQ